MKWPDLIGGPVIIGPLPSVSAAPSPPARQPCPAWLSRPLPLQASARRPPTRDGRRDCGSVIAAVVVWAITHRPAEFHDAPLRHEVEALEDGAGCSSRTAELDGAHRCRSKSQGKQTIV